MEQPFEIQIPPSTSREWVFPSAYGGAVRSPEPPQIHALMNSLRDDVGSLAAKKQAGGPMFPVRGAKELNQKLAEALQRYNMTAPVVAQEITHYKTDDIPKNETKSGNPVFRTLCHVKATVRLIAPDTSFIDMVGSGHGGDVDDKSGGKASTYAWKDAILKGLTIPHEDMVDTDDEAPTADGPAAKKVSREAPARGGSKEGKSRAGGDEGVLGVVPAVVEGNGRVAPEIVRPEAENRNLEYVVNQIKAAATVAELKTIADQIRSGVLALHGAEKLAATKDYIARLKELQEAGKQ